MGVEFEVATDQVDENDAQNEIESVLNQDTVSQITVQDPSEANGVMVAATAIQPVVLVTTTTATTYLQVVETSIIFPAPAQNAPETGIALNDVLPGTTARQTFETDFAEAVAAQTEGVEASDVTVTNIV